MHRLLISLVLVGCLPLLGCDAQTDGDDTGNPTKTGANRAGGEEGSLDLKLPGVDITWQVKPPAEQFPTQSGRIVSGLGLVQAKKGG